MKSSDVQQVAALQWEVLGDSSVTQLGIRFLIRFYQTVLTCSGCEAVVACDARGDIIGAAVGVADLRHFNAYVTPRIMLRLSLSLMCRWGLAVRFLRTAFEHKPERQVAAELLLLFVDGRRQGAGSGTRLLQDLERVFIQRRIIEYRVSVRSEIAGALAFYAARGFQYEDELMVLGRPMTYLTKRLGDTLAPSHREPSQFKL